MISRVQILGDAETRAALNGVPVDGPMYVAAPIDRLPMVVQGDGVEATLIGTDEPAEGWSSPALARSVWAALPRFERGEPCPTRVGHALRLRAYVQALQSLPELPPVPAFVAPGAVTNRDLMIATAVALSDAYAVDDAAIADAIQARYGVTPDLSQRPPCVFPWDGRGAEVEREAKEEKRMADEAKRMAEEAQKAAAEEATRLYPAPVDLWVLRVRVPVVDMPRSFHRFLEGQNFFTRGRDRFYLFSSPGLSAPTAATATHEWLGPDAGIMATSAEWSRVQAGGEALINLGCEARKATPGPLPEALDSSTAKGRAAVHAATAFLKERSDLVQSYTAPLSAHLCQVITRGFSLAPELAAAFIYEARAAFVPRVSRPPGAKYSRPIKRMVKGPDGEMREETHQVHYEPTADDLQRMFGGAVGGPSKADLVGMCIAAARGDGVVYVSPGELLPELSPSLLDRFRAVVSKSPFVAALERHGFGPAETTSAEAIDTLIEIGLIPSGREPNNSEKKAAIAALESMGYVSKRGATRVYVKQAAA